MAVVGLLFAGVPVRGDVIFSDNFNSWASPLWGNEIGNWTAQGGVYYAQSPSTSPETYSSLPFDLANFTLDLDINNVGDGGVWLRSSGVDDGILLVTGGQGYGSGNRLADAGQDLYFHVFSNGVASQEYALTKYVFTPGSDIHLHIVVTGNNYDVYLNGSSTPTLSLTSSMIAPGDLAAFDSFSSGQVALYDDSAQTFDNVVLSTPAPEPASFTLLGIGIAVVAGWRKLRLVRRQNPA